MVHSHTDLQTFRNDPLKRNAVNVTFTTNGKVGVCPRLYGP